MKESKGWVIAFLLAVVVSAAGSLVYDSGVFGKSVGQVKVASDTIYSRHYTSARQMFLNGDRVVVGECSPQDASIVVTRDTVVLTSPGRAPLGYRPLGVNRADGLVCLRQDSANVVFYRYKDKRDTTKHILLLEQPKGPAIVFFELSPCPETEK